MAIIPQTITLSNSQTVEVPEGADPEAFRKFQEAKLKLAATPKKKSRSRSRSKANRRTFRASTVLARMRLSGAEKQVEKRAEAMAEQVERVNGRSILVNAGGEFYGVLEVA